MCFFVGMLGKQSIRVCQFIMELYAGKYIHIPVDQILPPGMKMIGSLLVQRGQAVIKLVLISGMTSSPANLLVRHMVWIQPFSPTRPTASGIPQLTCQHVQVCGYCLVSSMYGVSASAQGLRQGTPHPEGQSIRHNRLSPFLCQSAAANSERDSQIDGHMVCPGTLSVACRHRLTSTDLTVSPIQSKPNALSFGWFPSCLLFTVAHSLFA